MIKIAFVIDTIESPTAGTEKQLLLLLKEIDRTRFAPYLCVLRNSTWLKEHFRTCELFVAEIYSFKKMTTLWQMARFINFLRREKIDIVQVHFRDSSIAGIIAGKIAGVKAIVNTMRNQGYWMTSSEIFIQRFLNRLSNTIITNSNSTRDWVHKVEKTPLEKIQVIYNAVNNDLFQAIDHAAKEKQKELLNIPPENSVIGIVANLREVKRIDVFIKAAGLVHKELPKVSFIVIGEGPKEKELMELADNLGLIHVIHFLGKREDVYSLLAAFDIGVLSSDSESFSNAVIEYLAAGLPIVSTDVGGVREIIEHSINGFVVPLGDYEKMANCLVKILKNTKYSSIKKINQEKAIFLFSLDKIINNYENFYSNAVCNAN